MRNIYRILPLIGVFLLTLIIQAQDTPTFTVNVGEQAIPRDSFGINVRSGPNWRYSIRGSANDGDVFTVTGRTDFDISRTCSGGYNLNADMWLRVDFQGVEGWVAFCLGSFTGDISQIPVVVPNYPVRIWDALFVQQYYRDQLGTQPTVPFVLAFHRNNRSNLHSTPQLAGSTIDVVSANVVYVVGRSADGFWIEVVYEGYASSVQHEWGDAPQTIRGWVVRSAFILPQGWEDSIPIIE